MDKVEISKGLLGTFLFALIWILQKVQSTAGSVFWFFFISPALWFFRKPKDSDRPFSYIVDSSKWSHRVIWWLLKLAFAINGKLNGLVRANQSYSRIVSWNEKVPLYGYIESKGLGSLEWLGKKYEDGTRGVDFMFLSRPKPTGYVNIIRKYLPQGHKKILIDLAWTTGDEAGQTFTIGTSIGSLKELRNETEDKYKPEYFYVPPKWLALSIEVCLSIGAIFAFVSAAVGLYSDLDSSKFDTLDTKVNNVSQNVSTIQSNLGSIKEQIFNLSIEQAKLTKIADKKNKSESVPDKK